MKHITRSLYVAFLALALPAFAQVGASMNADLSLSSRDQENQANREAQAHTENRAVSNTRASNQNASLPTVEVEASGPLEVQVLPARAQVGAQAEIQAQGEPRLDVEAIANIQSANTRTQSDTSAIIRIDGELVTIDSNAQESVDQVAEVDSSEDLALYANSLARSDVRIQAIEASNDEVAISFRDSGKLFGFINVGINRTAKIKADTASSDTEIRAIVSNPWWSIFVSGNTNAKSELEASLQSHTSANTSVSASPSAQAFTLSQIKASVDSYLEARARADV
ncbi:MAG: hypothetical protein ACKKL4_02380 [Patescibacteria group bacterium]